MGAVVASKDDIGVEKEVDIVLGKVCEKIDEQ